MCRPIRDWPVVHVLFVDVRGSLDRCSLRGYHALAPCSVGWPRHAARSERGQCSLFAVAHARELSWLRAALSTERRWVSEPEGPAESLYSLIFNSARLT